MRRTSLSVACCILLSACQTPVRLVDAENVTMFTDAYLFDGTQFRGGPLCVFEREIIACPPNPGERISLKGQFITPPFGDAHTHHFDGPYTVDWHTMLGMESGAFYAMTMTAPTRSILDIRDRLSGPGHIDVATSLGGITGPQSHPAEIYEALALGIRTYEDQVARADEIRVSRKQWNNAYFVVESGADVREQVGSLLQNDPDHVKVFLRKSDRYEEGYGKWGPGGGIKPALLPLIVDLARQANKRVAIATSNLADMRAAIEAGADLVTHLPCYQDSEADTDSPYYDVDSAEDCLLETKDAERAAKVGLAATLITTEWSKGRPGKIVDWERRNIAALKAAGVPLVVGTNAYGSSLTAGLIAGVDKEFFTPVEMLRIASMTTPQTIFPKRRVGCLDIGCEASFISFPRNPLEDFSVLGAISYRYKDGQAISVTD